MPEQSNPPAGLFPNLASGPGGFAWPAWMEALSLFALIVLTLLLFHESFSAEFTYDDYVAIVGNPQIQQFHFFDLFDIRDPQFGWHRQLRTLSFMVDYALFGSTPTGYHLHNLLWHVLSVLLFYAIVKKLSHRNTIAFLAAAIFAVHPIHVEVITNITNRKDLLCMAFLLASFISYDSFIREVGPKKWVWLTGSLVAWLLALFSKQVAIVLPLYLIFYEFLFVPRERRVLTHHGLLLIAGILLAGVVFLTFVLLVVDLENLDTSNTFKGYIGEPSLFSVGISSARMFWQYVGMLIWPNALCPHHLVSLSKSFLEFTTLFSWVGLLSLAGIAFAARQRWPLLSFGLGWFLISYLPISNLIPTAYMIADRYMYIPSAGFCIVIVWIGEAFYLKLKELSPRYAVPVISVVGSLVITGYALKTLAYNATWKNEGIIWQYALACSPGAWAHTSLGNHYYRTGRYPAALDELTQAIELGSHKAFDNRGNVFFAMGKNEEALRDYTLALALNPDWAKAYYDRGLVAFRLGYYEKAIVDYSRAIDLDPQYSEAYNNRGLAQEKLNRLNEALEDYAQATKLDPYNAAAHNNFGRVLFFAGNLEGAIKSYKHAEQLGMPQAKKILEFLTKEGVTRQERGLGPDNQPPN